MARCVERLKERSFFCNETGESLSFAKVIASGTFKRGVDGKSRVVIDGEVFKANMNGGCNVGSLERDSDGMVFNEVVPEAQKSVSKGGEEDLGVCSSVGGEETEEESEEEKEHKHGERRKATRHAFVYFTKLKLKHTRPLEKRHFLRAVPVLEKRLGICEWIAGFHWYFKHGNMYICCKSPFCTQGGSKSAIYKVDSQGHIYLTTRDMVNHEKYCENKGGVPVTCGIVEEGNILRVSDGKLKKKVIEKLQAYFGDLELILERVYRRRERVCYLVRCFNCKDIVMVITVNGVKQSFYDYRNNRHECGSVGLSGFADW